MDDYDYQEYGLPTEQDYMNWNEANDYMHEGEEHTDPYDADDAYSDTLLTLMEYHNDMLDAMLYGDEDA